MERKSSQAIPMLVSKILSNNGVVDVWGSGNQKEIIYMQKIVQIL